MIAKFIDNIEKIGKEIWNEIAGIDSPFLRYEFHNAMEKHYCVGKDAGWLPQHLVIEDQNTSKILGIMPLYLKFNSYGELVFDWAWADAFQRAGRQYYPKLVAAMPYTPAPGERMLIAKDASTIAVKRAMIQTLIQIAESNSLSSIHCLFNPIEDNQYFEAQGFVSRLGCQFHWHNHQYQDFSHFLSHFSSRKRKNIVKERKRCHGHGVTFQTLTGNQIDPDLWPSIYHFYQKTFIEKGGYASFTLAFFQEISVTMGEQLLVILSHYKEQLVAAAICYTSPTTLYGRHWGCNQDFDSLHFETCYYQGIDYAIENELALFEPGAQGEHKISRGFIPTETWSTHWIKDTDFRQVIYDFVDQEKKQMQDYIKELNDHLPFKKT